MTTFIPELGQAIFGQPHKEYRCSNIVDAALNHISYELDRVMSNVTQKEYASPFGNTGNEFKCDEFEVIAYSWGDDEQPYNFKWRHITISWYKWMGRGMSANINITPAIAAEMLDSCLAALRDYERDGGAE